MTGKIKLRRPGSPLVLRLFALGVLTVGVAGLAGGQMPPFEAGRLYLIALGMYLIAPVEELPKPERQFRVLLRRPRYLMGVLSVTCGIAAVLVQLLAQLVQRINIS